MLIKRPLLKRWYGKKGDMLVRFGTKGGIVNGGAGSLGAASRVLPRSVLFALSTDS